MEEGVSHPKPLNCVDVAAAGAHRRLKPSPTLLACGKPLGQFFAH